MEQTKDRIPPSSATMMKAGIWYTVSNFILRALGFLTVPVFSRIMSGSDYGSYSTFTACVTVMTVLTGFDAYTSIIRCKNEIDDLDGFLLSVLTVNTVVTAIFYVSFLFFPEFYRNLFQVNDACIHYMFLYLVCLPAFNLISTKQRAYYRYKVFVTLTAIISVGSVVLSLTFVYIIQDSLTARIIGQYAPSIVVGAISFLYIVIKGKHIQVRYCKYVLTLCLPLLPHLLAIYALSSSNRVLLTILCGSETTAIYSIAHSATNIVSVLFDSANKAWAPWLLDNMDAGKYEEVRKVSNFYFLLLMGIALMTVLLGPEVVFILGGERLIQSQYMLPALILGCAFQIVYTMYVNVEFYLKQTGITAAATIGASLIGVTVSIVLITIFGYMAAPIGTAASYGTLLLIHYICIAKLEYGLVFDRRFIFGGLLLFAVVCISATLFLYHYIYIRIAIIIFLLTLMILFVMKNKQAMLRMLRRK